MLFPPLSTLTRLADGLGLKDNPSLLNGFTPEIGFPASYEFSVIAYYEINNIIPY